MPLDTAQYPNYPTKPFLDQDPDVPVKQKKPVKVADMIKTAIGPGFYYKRMLFAPKSRLIEFQQSNRKRHDDMFENYKSKLEKLRTASDLHESRDKFYQNMAERRRLAQLFKRRSESWENARNLASELANTQSLVSSKRRKFIYDSLKSRISGKQLALGGAALGLGGGLLYGGHKLYQHMTDKAKEDNKEVGYGEST